MASFFTKLFGSWFLPSSDQTVKLEGLPMYRQQDLENHATALVDHTGRITGFIGARSTIQGQVPAGAANPWVQRTHHIHPRVHPYIANAATSQDRTSRARIPAPAPLPAAARTGVSPTPFLDGNADWDSWPNGQFVIACSLQFLEDHGRLRDHWSSTVMSGLSGGSEHAESWEGGKITRRRCNGVIECDRKNCHRLVRPATRPRSIAMQLKGSCACGGMLVHRSCAVIATLYTFKHGARYIHSGVHDHLRPPRYALTKAEKVEFAHEVEVDPSAGPRKLLVGRAGVNGPGPSVANISPLLLNADRIGYERRQITRTSKKMRTSIEDELDRFVEQNPNFVRVREWDTVQIICMQTPFMASLLIKSLIDDERVNGFVSDATHRFWATRNSLLLITLTYEPINLRRWVPVLITYMNGGTAEHYQRHFLELFRSIAEQCHERDTEVIDDLFANVVDFSEAQRNGFIYAFVDFWLEFAPEGRDQEQLIVDAEKLVKGCRQHFHEQVQRIQKISAIVDPSQIDIFANFAHRLLSSTSLEQFTSVVQHFTAAFPPAEPWIRWWAIPEHASMIFAGARLMDEKLWDCLPDTTNPEESQHALIYSVLGGRHSLIGGLKSLLVFVENYRKLAVADSFGLKIRHGRGERWKTTAAHHGHSQLARHRKERHARSDGRPPDTAAQLLSTKRLMASRRKSRSKHDKFETVKTSTSMSSKVSLLRSEPSFPWSNNSCWLDSSVTVLSAAATSDLKSLTAVFELMNEDQPLRKAWDLIVARVDAVEEHAAAVEGVDTSASLALLRDEFRRGLVRSPRCDVASMTSYETSLSWLYQISSPRFLRMITPGTADAMGVFRPVTSIIQNCRGSEFSGSPTSHWHLGDGRWRDPPHLTLSASQVYDGDMVKWFEDWISVSTPQTRLSGLGSCWRNGSNLDLCDGIPDSHEIVMHIPRIFVLHVADTTQVNNPGSWDIVKRLRPFGANKDALKRGLEYSIVGHIYFSPSGRHFKARYTNSAKDIFDYDGMQHNGRAIRRKKNTMKNALIGSTKTVVCDLPPGYTVEAIIYHLNGGAAAQKYFHEEQSRRARKFGLEFGVRSGHNIPTKLSLALPGFILLPDTDRIWFETPAKKGRDYIEVELPNESDSQNDSEPFKPVLKLKSQSKGPIIQDPDEASPSRETPIPRPRPRPTALQPAPKIHEKHASVASIGSSRASPESEEETVGPARRIPPFPIPSPLRTPSPLLPSRRPLPPPRGAPRKIRKATPLKCDGCGKSRKDGRDDEVHVQCEICQMWSHEQCLEPGIDWSADDVHFSCTDCDERWKGQYIVVPLDRHGSIQHAVWYPAILVQHRNTIASLGTAHEFELRWLDSINPAVYVAADSIGNFVAEDAARVFFRSWAELMEYQKYGGMIPSDQLGAIHAPVTQNPRTQMTVPTAVSKLFLSAIPKIVHLLSPVEPKDLDLKHPVLLSYFEYQMELDNRSHAARKACPDWLNTLNLAFPEFLDDVRDDVIQELVFHPDMDELPLLERNARANSMGRALLELLWIQNELGEPYNLNGDLLNDIRDGSVVTHGLHTNVALAEMFRYAKPSGILDVLAEMEHFKSSHVIYDRHVYQRRASSRSMQRDPIPVTIDASAKSNIFRYQRSMARRAASEAFGDTANGPNRKRSKA